MGEHTAPGSIDNLERGWASIGELCGDLTEAQWDLPTGCPGWSVKDHVSHLVDYEARALGRPGPDHVPADLSHTKNALGESNEVGVDARRGQPGVVVLAELREVAVERLARLRALTEEDFDREVPTPAGPGTVSDMLRLRVMDTWSHEQDIRRAVGRPGHTTGPVADEALTHFSRFLPIVVAKRAGATDGQSVAFVFGDHAPLRILVRDGRANVVEDLPGEPTVVLTMPAPTVAALVGGRSDAPDDVEVRGDAALAQRVLDSLGFMP